MSSKLPPSPQQLRNAVKSTLSLIPSQFAARVVRQSLRGESERVALSVRAASEAQRTALLIWLTPDRAHRISAALGERVSAELALASPAESFGIFCRSLAANNLGWLVNVLSSCSDDQLRSLDPDFVAQSFPRVVQINKLVAVRLLEIWGNESVDFPKDALGELLRGSPELAKPVWFALGDPGSPGNRRSDAATARPRYVFLADDWGTSKGGPNVVNMELAVALAQSSPPNSVWCVIVYAASENPLKPETIQKAADKQVTLTAVRTSAQPLHLGERSVVLDGRTHPDYAQLQALLPPNPDSRTVTHWIGHDDFTGELAIACSKINGDRSVVIHHTDYDVVSALKVRTGPPNRQNTRVDNMAAILSTADHVFAVGPKLVGSARSLISRSTNEDKPVHELIPGFPGFRNSKRQTDNTFKVLTFGRMDPADDVIKQGRLAAHAFACAAKARSPGGVRSPELRFEMIGVDAKNANVVGNALKKECELKPRPHALLRKRGKGASEGTQALAISARAFSTDRDQLFGLAGASNLVLALSLHDGFGMTAWEALGVGTPIIVGQNTGVAQFLMRAFVASRLGPGINIVPIVGAPPGDSPLDADVLTVSQSIASVVQRELSARAEVAKRRRALASTCTWRNCAQMIALHTGSDAQFEKYPIAFRYHVIAYLEQWSAETAFSNVQRHGFATQLVRRLLGNKQ